ncbi:MAG TPA: hypothetical protein VNO30_19500 [Kofleriaceae bacterium]|nr:hypothetical protein [Kofleriaceae bacterium]
MGRTLLAAAAVAALSLASDAAPAGPTPTRITVWGQFGGATYAGPLAGAMITERREVELGAGEVRISGVAATLEPASVQLRDLTEPGATVTEQRFVPGAGTPTELLARHVGDAVTIVTPRGEITGVLRAADEQTLVVELGQGDQRRLSILRRDFVQDVRLPAGASDQPSLVVRMAGKKPGKHAVELTYRAAGLTWSADYLAVLDEAARTMDFSAWATVKNATGTSFERAELVLASTSSTPAAAATGGKPAGPIRFAVPSPLRLAAGDAVQVELVPARVAAKTTPVVTYEAMEDPSSAYQDSPGDNCTELSGGGLGGTAELALEVAVPSQVPLPEGKVRVFRRQGERLDVIGEEDLRSGAGFARIKLAGDAEVIGERKAVSCNVDERAKTIHERVTVRVENRGKLAVDVVVREYLWRWPVWKLEAEDKKGLRTGTQTQEYRVHVPARGSQTVTYAVIYTW